jgi:hypothetical protein
MAEFRVVIEGLELDDRSTRVINDRIQKAVLDHLAEHDLTVKGKERGVVAWRPHPDWYGLVAYILDQGQLRDIPGVADINQRFG